MELNIKLWDNAIIPIKIWEIYERSFPANERKTPEKIIENVASGKESLVIATQNDTIVGFALIFNLKTTHYRLLDYLAVRSDIKQKGVGTAIMQYIRRNVLNGTQSLVIEADKPTKLQNQETYEQNIKRVAFYLKNGVKIIDALDYILPSLNFSTKTIQWLMILENNGRETIEKEELKELISNLYNQNYGDYFDEIDLNQMIDQLNTHHKLISFLDDINLPY